MLNNHVPSSLSHPCRQILRVDDAERNLEMIVQRQLSFTSGQETLQATMYADSPVGVVLCPPHPLHGGSRADTRIVRVARELASHNISALCIDYGRYGKGVTEIQNVQDAISFMRERVDSLGLLGYSFGAVVASNAAVYAKIDGLVAISILKRVNSLEASLMADCPKLFVHGKRDKVALYTDFENLYAEARGTKEKLVLDTDHFYMDNYPTIINSVSKIIARFFIRIFALQRT